MLEQNHLAKGINHPRKELSNSVTNEGNATSSLDVIKMQTTQSDKGHNLEKGNINSNFAKEDHLNNFDVPKSNTEKNLLQMRKVLPTFEQENSTSFRPEMSQAISNFWGQLRKANLEFAKAVDHVQKVSPDTGRSVEEPNIYTKWEDTFRQWSKPLSKEAQKRFGRAERAIRRAIYKNIILPPEQSVGVFTKSSYRSGVSNEFSSDLDMKVSLWEPSLRDYDAFQKFRGLVEDALSHKFGRENVERGSNVLHINKDVFKVELDILASFAYKRYTGRYKKDGTIHSAVETGFYNKDHRYIIAQHEEGYANMTEKHKGTGKRYKKAVRILKKLRDEMKEANIEVSKKVPSQLIETMLYHVPDKAFDCKNLTGVIKNALEYCISRTQSNEGCKEWRQLYNTDDQGKFRSLFGDDRQQPWSREQAHEFLLAVRDYLGFESSFSRNDANAERLSEIRPQVEEQVEKLKVHLENFNKYSRDNKGALSDVLKASGVNQHSFKALLERAPSYCKEIRYYLKVSEPNLEKLESYYQNLQSMNQGFDMIQKRLLGKLTLAGSSATEVENLGKDLQALFGVDQETIGNIEQNMEKGNSEIKHKKWEKSSIDKMHRKTKQENIENYKEEFDKLIKNKRTLEKYTEGKLKDKFLLLEKINKKEL